VRKRSGSGLARRTSPRSTTTVSGPIASASSEASIFGTPAGRRDPIDDAEGPQLGEELHGLGQRSPFRQQLAEQLAVAGLYRLDLVVGERPPQLARDGAGEEPAAHADPPMNPPAVDRQPGLGERALPRKDVGVDRVYQRAVEIEDQRGHRGSLLRRCRKARGTAQWRRISCSHAKPRRSRRTAKERLGAFVLPLGAYRSVAPQVRGLQNLASSTRRTRRISCS